MPVSAGFRIFILEQLEQTARDVRARSMFGGVGIYAGEHFFALIAADTLYFKVDDDTRPAYVALGMEPFRPYGERGETMQYYQVPADLLEDPDALRPWVAGAVAAARRAKSKPRRR
ncbi:MAG: TfoX/Sxy family protein [Vicinamibacterales bacterium]